MCVQCMNTSLLIEMVVSLSLRNNTAVCNVVLIYFCFDNKYIQTIIGKVSSTHIKESMAINELRKRNIKDGQKSALSSAGIHATKALSLKVH